MHHKILLPREDVRHRLKKVEFDEECVQNLRQIGGRIGKPH
jgi:hypothetical protein